MKRTISLSLVFFLFAGCGPVWFVPGVRLGGTAAETPASFANVEIPEEVQLRAAGGTFPRVVNLWAVESNGALYISGDEQTVWVERIRSEPNVHLRVNDQVWALRATPVDDAGEQRRVAEAYITKYRETMLSFNDGEEPDPDELVKEGRSFRLEKR